MVHCQPHGAQNRAGPKLLKYKTTSVVLGNYSLLKNFSLFRKIVLALRFEQTNVGESTDLTTVTEKWLNIPLAYSFSSTIFNFTGDKLQTYVNTMQQLRFRATKKFNTVWTHHLLATNLIYYHLPRLDINMLIMQIEEDHHLTILISYYLKSKRKMTFEQPK